ncbi:AlpA family phage regulatory protein [Geomonas paludis]|uniref:AlpA family phage regulatory protein n=1 Tax=Geomonas paludis TaxID=2740185 RepID=A0ABY4LIQ3_9BACT|nr:AlpA family phage regulatory protein [Geomonas paludis]UPU37880.1 AlpA family phage regulatory protein [Geomonas paludis]
MEDDKLIRRKKMLDLIGLSRTTQWRMEKAGRFPARVKLSSGAVGWHLAEVEAWVRGRERVQLGTRQREEMGG